MDEHQTKGSLYSIYTIKELDESYEITKGNKEDLKKISKLRFPDNIQISDIRALVRLMGAFKIDYKKHLKKAESIKNDIYKGVFNKHLDIQYIFWDSVIGEIREKAMEKIEKLKPESPIFKLIEKLERYQANNEEIEQLVEAASIDSPDFLESPKKLEKLLSEASKNEDV